MPRTDLTGQQFGRLIVMGLASTGSHGKHACWECLCGCGKRTVVVSQSLRRGHTKSCGCYRKEVLAEPRPGINKIHGRHGTPEYRSWQAMLTRCRNKGREDFKYYGGRGIKVCKRWRKFENFFEDMGRRPPELTLERVDNGKDYTPGNCKWATRKEQANNQRPRKRG